MDEKIDMDIDIEAPGLLKKIPGVLNLPKPLSLEEKKYLLAVERGDMANVRRMIQKAFRQKNININCVDSLGRGALTLAIDGENLEMVELLVIMGVATKDALLHAINVEFVEAVELLLEHEELIHKDGEPYSWQTVDLNTAMFTPDITPLILAAHRNNYEIIKILLDRGATLPMPHDVKCGCDECIRESNEDSLRHSLSRVNEYRALASPSLIALSSSDPLLTAFQLSWELRNLAFAEQECKSEYLELRKQCQQFAVDLLDQSRSSHELAIILNHDPDSPPYVEGEHMKLARLELAINYKQKKFVAHPNIQQLLSAIWYEGVPGFRRKTAIQKLSIILRVAVMFPFYCMLYMIAPNTSTGKLMRKPFMKFLIHASSYLFFLFILILVSLRAEVQVIELFGTASMKRALEEQLQKQRGNVPSFLELLVCVYVLGFIWEETHEIYVEGITSYLRNMWNFIDFTRNSLYCAVALLRAAAFLQQMNEISRDPSTAYIPRENWDAFDPQLIAEGLFAAANVFSALKLVHLFSINPHLGPLQISLGRMVIDIVKFFFIYSLVLFAFACGLNQLLWYFADLERKKCYVLPGEQPDWDNAGDSCMKWRSFGNVFEASQSLFWASFGMVGLENFELAGIKSYTRFWGLLMFGSYSVINVIVLLNLLIAMMSNSYAIIEEASDTEWKFARTKLWMSYFEESATLPPPFNIFPTPKMLIKLLGIRKKDKLRRMSSKRRCREEKERDYRYTAVMRSLVWRYVSAMHRKCEENPVTEDDVNEVKGDISAFRYELLEILEKSGMDVSSADKKDKTVLGKRMKIWERRLMKDFQVAPVAVEEEMEQLITEPIPENEDSLAKFRRIAKLAVLNSSTHKWGQIVKGVCEASQIGRCNNREAFKNQQHLQRAMEEAKKLVTRSPLPGNSRCISPIEMPETTGSTIIDIMEDFKQDLASESGLSAKSLLNGTGASRSATPFSFLNQLGKAPLSTISKPPKSPGIQKTIPKSPSIKSSESTTSKTVKLQSPDNTLQLTKPSSRAPSRATTPVSSKPSTPESILKQPKLDTPKPTAEKSISSRPTSPDVLSSKPVVPDKPSNRPATPEKDLTKSLSPEKPESRPSTPKKLTTSTPTDKSESSDGKSETKDDIIVTQDQKSPSPTGKTFTPTSRSPTPTSKSPTPTSKSPTTTESPSHTEKSPTPTDIIPTTTLKSPSSTDKSPTAECKSPEIKTPSHSPKKSTSPVLPKTPTPSLKSDDVKVEKLVDVSIPTTSVTFVDETSSKKKSDETDKEEVKPKTDKEEVKPKTDIKTDGDAVISRPVVPEKPSAQGMIPPPPVKQKPHAPPVPELKPTSLPTFEVTPAKESPDHTAEKSTEPISQPSTSEKPVVKIPSTIEDAAIVPTGEMISMPSTESLIPSDKPVEKPPVPSRSARKIEDIKPTKRQPKTGWL